MIHLPMPEGADDVVIEKQCRKLGWKSYRTVWLDAVQRYRTKHGDPWSVEPAVFTERQKTKLRKLYSSRAQSKAIKQIRDPAPPHRCCPVCGSTDGPSLDHALPQDAFPEFSIVRENLVPACTTCNSTQKRGIYRGEKPPERLIHPYYDDWLLATLPIWQVKFGDDLEALVLKAVPTKGVPKSRIPTVQFHLKTVLGKRWSKSGISYWASLPSAIRIRMGDDAPTPGDIRDELSKRLREAELTEGINSWTAAFLRGALDDPKVLDYLATAVADVPPF